MLLLSKFIYLFIHPLTWIVAFILLWAFLPQAKWKVRFKWMSLIALFFFTNSFFVNEAYRLWEIPGEKKEKLNNYEVGIVLGGMFHYEEDTERLSVRNGADRIWQAIDLYKAKKINKIALIGKNGKVGDKWMDESILLKNQLVEWGIPAKDILVEAASLNTYQNALYTTELLQDYPSDAHFLLITTAYHIRRATACYLKQGIRVEPFATGTKSKRKRDYQWHDFIIPSPDALSSWFPLSKEIVGMLAYKVRGYA